MVSTAFAQENSPEAENADYLDVGVSVGAGDFSQIQLEIMSPRLGNFGQLGLSIGRPETEEVNASFEITRRSFPEYGLLYGGRTPVAPGLSLVGQLGVKFARVTSVKEFANGSRQSERSNLIFTEYRLGTHFSGRSSQDDSTLDFGSEFGIQLRQRWSEKAYFIGDRFIRDVDPGVYLRLVLSI